MTIYYIAPEDSDDRFALDSTSDIQLDESGKTTSLPVESGEEITDHYINSNTKISMNGTISSIKSSVNLRNKTPEDFINGIRQLKQSGKPFSVYFSNKINPLTNCLFENLSISQNKKRGSVGEDSAYKISFSIKQVRIVKVNSLRVERSGRVIDSFTPKAQSGKGTKDPKGKNVVTRKADENKRVGNLLLRK